MAKAKSTTATTPVAAASVGQDGTLPAVATAQPLTGAPNADPAAPTLEKAGSIGQDAHPSQGLELAAAVAVAPAGNGGNSVEGAGEADEVPGLWIRSVSPKGIRRCGFRFGPDGVGIALSALDEEQIERLTNDPDLAVEPSLFSNRVQG